MSVKYFYNIQEKTFCKTLFSLFQFKDGFLPFIKIIFCVKFHKKIVIISSTPWKNIHNKARKCQ